MATRGNQTLLVEAKGETSSKAASARYGKPFSPKQVQSHVAKALYWAAARIGEEGRSVAIALPNTGEHITAIWPIEHTLSNLGVGIFWVSADGTVSPNS
jgi:hypothetical protein